MWGRRMNNCVAEPKYKTIPDERNWLNLQPGNMFRTPKLAKNSSFGVED